MRTRLAACGAIALVLPALARAGEAAPVEPTVTVGEIVVQLPRGEAQDDPTASATVVEAGRYAGEAKTVAELVGTAPGVVVRQYGGLGQLATVSIRGSTSDQVTVLLDGLPLNGPAGGGVDLSSIPPEWIDRIEVVRGAEGAHYGAGALGGVVNIVTRRPQAGAWSAQAAGGSFSTGEASADGAVGGERWAAMGALSLDSTEGDFGFLYDPQPTLPGNALVPMVRGHNAAQLGGALARARGSVAGGVADALVELSGGRRELPGTLYDMTPRDFEDDRRAGAIARFARPGVAPGLTLSGELGARYDGVVTRLQSLGGDPLDQSGASGTAALKAAWLAGPSALEATLSTGLEGLAGGGMGRHDRPSFAGALSDELALWGGRLRLAPAARVESVGAFSGASGKLGAGLALWGPLRARASAGRTFRAPSFAELYLEQGLVQPNPALQPETGWSGDAALVADGALGLASVGVFSTLYRDLIVYETASFQREKPFNDGKALARGVEAELATAPLFGGLTAGAAYTFLDTATLRGDGTVLGKALPHRPRHVAFLRLAYDRGVAGVHAEAQYVGAQWQDAENLRPVPAALLVSAGASLRIARNPDLHLHVEVKNLLDDRTLQDGFGNPLPGRMVLVTVRAGSTYDGT